MDITCEKCQQPTENFKLLNCFHTFCSDCLVDITTRKSNLASSLECSACAIVTRLASNGAQSLEVGHKIHCKEHNKELSLYCNTCEQPICSLCTIKSHCDHQHSGWKNVLSSHKEEVKATMVMMNKTIVDVCQAISRQKAIISDSSKKVRLVETDIISTLDTFHSILNVRKEALTSQLHDQTQEKLEDITFYQDHLNSLLTQLNCCLSFMEEGLAACNELHLLSLKGNMVRYVQHLQSVCKIALKYVENDFHVKLVSAPNNMREICSEFGNVVVSDNCFENASKDMGYTLDPTLSLKISVQRINSPLFHFTKLKGPSGITFNQNGEMIVAEGFGDRVSIFSSSGDKLYSFGTYGSAEGEFSFPCAVVVDEIGNIYVVDGSNNRIQKFTRDGKFIAVAGNKGSGKLQFCEPDGMAINPVNRKIYVVDNNSHRIQVLNQDLSFHSMFGSKGYEGGSLYYPWGVSCASNGDVYVTDSGNCSVKVFSAGGQFLREFGGKGNCKGCLKWPTGIWVTKNGIVYVSEYGNHRVSVFTVKGHFFKCFGKRGNSREEFGNLRGVAVDSNGLIYVCDTDNNRIALY